jgi:hypothetical protein
VTVMPELASLIPRFRFNNHPSAMVFDTVTNSTQGPDKDAHKQRLRFSDDTILGKPASWQRDSSVEPSTGDVRDELIHVLLQQYKSQARELKVTVEKLLTTREDLTQEQARRMGETAGLEDTVYFLKKQLESQFYQHEDTVRRGRPDVTYDTRGICTDYPRVCTCCTCCIDGGRNKRKRELSCDSSMLKRRRCSP